MPKNKGKGGKNRRRGKNENDVLKREIIFKEEGQAYAQVQKMLGNGRLTAFCFDGKSRLCHIRGKLRKKVWINTGDIILVGLRDYQDDKADVILKYNPDEARVLKTKGELPENAKLNEGGDDQDEGGVEFADMGLDLEDEKDNRIELPSDNSDEESEEEEEDEDGEEESSSSEEEEESSEEESEVDEEQLARGNYRKPGARDRYGKANKGKPRK
uniref:Eukaryotic translation initiation factor 4C n=1 Tax=Steinernema glaseri TaxID=37863 RepID=A0A1I7ZNH6_9BILA